MGCVKGRALGLCSNMADGEGACSFGGYDLVFVETPPAEYECPICQLILRDPHIVDCCGYKYCNQCIIRISNANKPCPMCQTNGFRTMQERQLQRKISDLVICCPEKMQGCPWTGEIRDLEAHLSSLCAYIVIKCPLECGVDFQRIHLEKHQEDECPKRSPELKLLSLTRKFEERLSIVETKCNEQEEKIKQLVGLEEKCKEQEKMILGLKEELTSVKCEKELQDITLKQLQESVQEVSSVQESALTGSLKDVEHELIKRCLSLPVRVTTTDPSWVSPSFYSHPKGYVLQLVVNLRKFTSALDSLAHSIFSSGRNPEKGPVKMSLNVLPQRDYDNLEWPVYVSVDLFLLSTTDSSADRKIFTLTKYKDVKLQEDPRESSDDTNEEVIGYARHVYSCRVVILNIRCSPDPPPLEEDSKAALDSSQS